MENTNAVVYLKASLDVKEENAHEPKVSLKTTFLHFVYGFLVFVFIFVSYVIFKPLNGAFDSADGSAAKFYGAFLLLALFLVFLILKAKNKLTFENKLLLILSLGLVMRLTYMLYTESTTRQYDTWSSNGNGHYDYALYIYENWALPGSDAWFVGENLEYDIYQFYHPPLNYMVQALFMKIFSYLCWDSSLTATTEDLFSACQILSCFYSFLCSIYLVKTLRLTRLKKKSVLLGALFMVLFPRFYQLSGQLNNDLLASLLVILCFYRVFKWRMRGKHTWDFFLAGLYLGLAMMTKLSAVTPALGLAFIFLIELIRSIRHKEGSIKVSKLLLQYVLFLAVCAPLGLWFQYYSHVVYGLPYNFVYRALNSMLFTGPRSYIEARTDIFSLTYYDSNNSGLIYTSDLYNILVRYILPFYPQDFLASFPFCSAFGNYNILTYAIRSSIFGEFSYYNGEAFGTMAIIAAYILWFSLVIYVVYALVKRKKFSQDEGLSLAILVSMIIFYLYLQVSMPFGCSMDFRYIVPIVYPLGHLLAMAYEDFDKNKDKKFPKFMASTTLMAPTSLSVLRPSSISWLSKFALDIYPLEKDGNSLFSTGNLPFCLISKREVQQRNSASRLFYFDGF